MSWFPQQCKCSERLEAIEKRISDLEGKLKDQGNRISGVSIAAGLMRPKTGKTG